MAFIPNLSSTPKFVSVLHQPSHFIVPTPLRRKPDEHSVKVNHYRKVSRPLRKRRSEQSNVSTAINRQCYFPDENTRDQKRQTLFCLPWTFFQRSRRRRRHGPCHV